MPSAGSVNVIAQTFNSFGAEGSTAMAQAKPAPMVVAVGGSGGRGESKMKEGSLSVRTIRLFHDDGNNGT